MFANPTCTTLSTREMPPKSASCQLSWQDSESIDGGVDRHGSQGLKLRGVAPRLPLLRQFRKGRGVPFDIV